MNYKVVQNNQWRRALIYPYKNNGSTERKFRGKVVKDENKYVPCFNQWTHCHKIYKYQNSKYSVLIHVNLYPYIGNKHFYSYIWRNKTIEELETYSFQESSNYQWFFVQQTIHAVASFSITKYFPLCSKMLGVGCHQIQQLKPDKPLLCWFKDSISVLKWP